MGTQKINLFVNLRLLNVKRKKRKREEGHQRRKGNQLRIIDLLDQTLVVGVKEACRLRKTKKNHYTLAIKWKKMTKKSKNKNMKIQDIVIKRDLDKLLMFLRSLRKSKRQSWIKRHSCMDYRMERKQLLHGICL